MVSVVAEVSIRRDGAVLWITLDRPDALNALNAPMYAGLAVALEEAADPAVRAVVLTGAGRGFCSGQDVSELTGPTYGIADRIRTQLNTTVLALRRLEKPVIAAVNGPAAGAGLSLALACDVRVASDAAVFAPAFSRIGLAPDSGATWLAARLLGSGHAFEWFTTGRNLSAPQALEWGLVSEVVPADELAGARGRGGAALRGHAHPRGLGDEAPARPRARPRRWSSSSRARRSHRASS